MIWFILAVAAVLLAYLLVRTLRVYEQESAATALQEVERLSELTEHLEKRIENLEAIVTEVEAEPGPTAPQSHQPATSQDIRRRVRS